MRRLVPLIAMACFASGCAHALVIDTDPTGAQVRIDDEQVGKTPYTLDDKASTGHTYHVVLSLDGYQPHTLELQQKLQPMRAVGGGAAAVVGCTVLAGGALLAGVTNGTCLALAAGVGLLAGAPFYLYGWQLNEQSTLRFRLEPVGEGQPGHRPNDGAPRFKYVPPPGEPDALTPPTS